MTHWYRQSFRKDYLALYPHRGLPEARADAAAIVALVSPPKEEPLLDLCCGAGRHLQALFELGFADLTGVDLSRALLRVARRRLDRQGAAAVRLVRSDMRRIPFRARFATILSLFTSFGYFDRSQEDEAVLTAACAALHPGGTLVMDTLNRPWTIAHLRPRSEQALGGAHVTIERALSADGSRVEKTTRIEPATGRRNLYRESVRMYSADDLRAMLARSGFADVRFHGGLDGCPYDEACPRIVAVARRAKGGGAP